MAGYSGTPLAKKLGIKSGSVIKLVDAPEYYLSLFTDWPYDVDMNSSNGPYDVVHFFALDALAFTNELPQLKSALKPNGSIWVSWPKKSSKIPTSLNENLIRNHAISIGLVDIKVCAVDETWSALKLVIPVKNRNKA